MRGPHSEKKTCGKNYKITEDNHATRAVHDSVWVGHKKLPVVVSTVDHFFSLSSSLRPTKQVQATLQSTEQCHDDYLH